MAGEEVDDDDDDDDDQLCLFRNSARAVEVPA